MKSGGCGGQVVGREAVCREKLRWPGGGVGGGADDEFAARAEKRGGGFDHKCWRSEAAGRHQVGSTPILLLFYQALDWSLVDDHPLRPPESSAVQFQESSPGQRGLNQRPRRLRPDCGQHEGWQATAASQVHRHRWSRGDCRGEPQRVLDVLVYIQTANPAARLGLTEHISQLRSVCTVQVHRSIRNDHDPAARLLTL